ncbi:MAG: hypothetical protein ABW185_01760 [Sedimenticola sp.]
MTSLQSRYSMTSADSQDSRTDIPIHDMSSASKCQSEEILTSSQDCSSACLPDPSNGKESPNLGQNSSPPDPTQGNDSAPLDQTGEPILPVQPTLSSTESSQDPTVTEILVAIPYKKAYPESNDRCSTIGQDSTPDAYYKGSPMYFEQDKQQRYSNTPPQVPSTLQYGSPAYRVQTSTVPFLGNGRASFATARRMIHLPYAAQHVLPQTTVLYPRQPIHPKAL